MEARSSWASPASSGLSRCWSAACLRSPAWRSVLLSKGRPPRSRALARALAYRDASLPDRPPADRRDHVPTRATLNVVRALDPERDDGWLLATERRIRRLRAMKREQESP